MSDLHAKIMNLQCNEPDLNRTSVAPAYRLGHRDARHAAAELAATIDNRIEALEAALARADELADQCELFANGKLYSMNPVLEAREAYREARK